MKNNTRDRPLAKKSILQDNNNINTHTQSKFYGYSFQPIKHFNSTYLPVYIINEKMQMPRARTLLYNHRYYVRGNNKLSTKLNKLI